jgi:hypothetical protein
VHPWLFQLPVFRLVYAGTGTTVSITVRAIGILAPAILGNDVRLAIGPLLPSAGLAFMDNSDRVSCFTGSVRRIGSTESRTRTGPILLALLVESLACHGACGKSNSSFGARV